MDFDEGLSEMTDEAEFRAVYPIVFNYTVPIKARRHSKDDDLGAGVLIDVGGRQLIATAGHCINEDPAVLDDTFSIPSESKVRIVDKRVHRTLDIGYLEVERSSAVPALNRGECSLPMLCLEPLPLNGDLHVVGFPVGARDLRESTLHIVKQGYGSNLLRAENDRLQLRAPKLKGSSEER